MTPQPDPKALVPHPEDFEAWCQHPVTRFVASAWAHAAQQQCEAWMQMSWAQGDADPDALLEFRTRADAYRAFLETPLERYAALIEKA